jgi:hypothetical protein
MASINIQPAVLDLALYAGDGVEFRLICTDSDKAPVDISGVIEAEVRVDRVTEDPPIVEFTADIVDPTGGIVVLSLTGDQTQELVRHPSVKPGSGKFAGVWDVQWTPTGKEPRTLCQGKVDCVADVTR